MYNGGVMRNKQHNSKGKKMDHFDAVTCEEFYSDEERHAWEQRLEAEENDGQPDEYTEWQDLYEGDDCDHGQFDCC